MTVAGVDVMVSLCRPVLVPARVEKSTVREPLMRAPRFALIPGRSPQLICKTHAKSGIFADIRKITCASPQAQIFPPLLAWSRFDSWT